VIRQLDKVLTNYTKLRAREKIFLVLLILAITISISYQLFFKHLGKGIRNRKMQIKKQSSRLADLKERFPKVDEQRQHLESLQIESDNLFDEISKIEVKLPNKRNTFQLVGELGRLAKGFSISSLRKKEEVGDEYSKIYIELKFSAPYSNIISYMKSLESISPFLVIEELEISEPRPKAKEKGVPVRLVVSSLLGEVSLSENLRAKDISEPAGKLRDVFISRAKPASRVRKTDLRLEGITYDVQNATAIINTDVVRIGSEVGDMRVKSINPDSVILTNGFEERILRVDR